MEMTEFQKLTVKGTGIRRGRPATLTPSQKRHRQEVAKIKNRLRNEARRRANTVLQSRYAEEFDALMASEYDALKGEARYRIPSESEFLGVSQPTASVHDLTI